MRFTPITLFVFVSALSLAALVPGRADAIATTQNKCKPIVATWKAQCENPYSKCTAKAANDATKRSACLDKRNACNEKLDAKAKQKGFSLWDCI